MCKLALEKKWPAWQKTEFNFKTEHNVDLFYFIYQMKFVWIYFIYLFIDAYLILPIFDNTYSWIFNNKMLIKCCFNFNINPKNRITNAGFNKCIKQYYTGRPKKSVPWNKKLIKNISHHFFSNIIIVCVSPISSPSNTLYFLTIDHLIAEIWSI